MKRFEIIIFFIFLLVGILTLLNEDVDKFNYVVVWITLIIKLFADAFTV